MDGELELLAEAYAPVYLYGKSEISYHKPKIPRSLISELKTNRDSKTYLTMIVTTKK